VKRERESSERHTSISALTPNLAFLHPGLRQSPHALNLDKQKIAVFGGARGIGRAIADGFLTERCRVWTFDREPNESVVPPGQASVIGDVTQYDEVSAFADAVGDVDHVVFSVGAGSGKFGFPFWNLEPSDWARVLEINLIGAVNVAHAFAPKLIARGKGSMLFLVSVAGQIGSRRTLPTALPRRDSSISPSARPRTLAPYAVRVNALSPGMVKTDLNRSVWEAGQANLPPSERVDYAIWAEEKIRKVSPARTLADAAGVLPPWRSSWPPITRKTSPARRSTSTAARSCTRDRDFPRAASARNPTGALAATVPRMNSRLRSGEFIRRTARDSRAATEPRGGYVS